MDTIKKQNLCPACGFPLSFEPWDGNLPSDEICPCCGIQFGYDDAWFDDPFKRQQIYEKWRKKWIAGGLKWWSKGNPPPSGWDPVKQLEKFLRGEKKREEEEGNPF